MYTKKIYFSSENQIELQTAFDDVPGVLNTSVGKIDDSINGIEIVFNPKKTDISTLMDILFSNVNPFKNPVGVHYLHGEDEPQIELHLNFIATYGKQPVVSCTNLTINDPNSNPNFSRKCLAFASRIKNFLPIT